MKKTAKIILCAAAALAFCAGGVLMIRQGRMSSAAGFVMDAVADQKVYGPSGKEAITAVQDAFREMENRLSLYKEESDIVRINKTAGSGEAVGIDERTYALLQQTKALGKKENGAFSITIAPLSLAWGVTSDSPRVPLQEEILSLLPLVNDEDLILENGTARLAKKGQAIDLGGIAKGAACETAREIYDQYHIRSALCWIGGSSIYARGTKPNGSPWRLGFRDPAVTQTPSVASFEVKDAVFCTSGGYERRFEQDGVFYHHILDPKTGYPAESDIVSIGVLCENGAEADFYSTALFIEGKQAALSYYKNGGEGLMLDKDNNIYVSRGLRKSFRLDPQYKDQYKIIYVE